MKFKKTARYVWGSLFALIFVYLALSFKNPFTPTSIIPNLEPYPDSFYYAQPAWNFVHGEGFTMKYFTNNVSNIVPPLYSLFLIPFFALFRDVRSFFIANEFLMIGTIILFYLTSRKIFQEKQAAVLLPLLLTFLFATNFYIYTIPSLLMAEVPTMFLVVLGIYLLSIAVSDFAIITASFLGLALLLIKFSSLPLSVAFYLSYGYKVMREKRRSNAILNYLIMSGVAIGLFAVYYFKDRTGISERGSLSNVFDWRYLIPSLSFYGKSLLAQPTHYLWFVEKLQSFLLSVLMLLGAYFGIANKTTRKYALSLLFILATTFLFLGFFYSVDLRYMIALYPLLLIFAGFGIQTLFRFAKTKAAWVVMILLILYLFVPFLGQRGVQPTAVTLARQVAANILGRETPWYYKAVIEFNNFFANPQYKSSYLGTFLPPYLVNYYTNHTYIYLPLSRSQDFFSAKGKLSEAMGIDTIDAYYTRLLKSGKRVFISNSFAGNKKEWGEEFESLKKKFNATLVKEGCLGSCNIYELHLQD